MSYLLVTNDDGVNAPGILALTQAMRALGEVEVAAPAMNQSAGGHKKTLFQPISFTNTQLADGTHALSINGSPADCIALCAMGLVTQWPARLVVSGINRGGNMGQDITYSGTVTAALEATINGVPALAVSLARRDADRVEDYAEAARVAQIVVKKVLQMSLPPFTILNLNIPPGPVKGIRLVRQGVRIYHDQLEFNEDRTSVRIVGPEPSGRFEELGTDLWAVHQGYASLTPIHLDMTAHRFLAELAAWDITL